MRCAYNYFMWLQRFSALLLLFSALAPFAPAPAARPNTTFVHKPARMFHGNALHEELWVVVNGERIGAGGSCRGRLPGSHQPFSG